MERPAPITCVAVFCLGAAGCSPYVARYTHLIFEAQEGLEVLERSTTSPDTEGVELHSPKVGLPLKARLSRSTYTIVFDMPLQTSPAVFLAARNVHGAPLRISGAHVKRVHPGSAAEFEGFEYSFYVKEANGESLSFAIEDPGGNIVGSEVLPYKIVSRGYSFGIDAV